MCHANITATLTYYMEQQIAGFEADLYLAVEREKTLKKSAGLGASDHENPVKYGSD